MNVFTEEVLEALQNGNTPTTRINNAINLIRYRNLTDDALDDLLTDVLRNSINYRSWIWIADDIEGFVYALKQEVASRRTSHDPRCAEVTANNRNVQEVSCEDFFIYDDIEKLKRVLATLLLGKGNKSVAVTLLALDRLGILNIEKINRASLYRCIRKEIARIGDDSGINACLKMNDKRQIEVDKEVEMLRNLLARS